MDKVTRLKRLSYRAWHRGTMEADLMIGGFADAYSAGWSDEDIDWFEALLDQQDVDIMAWAIGTQEVPDKFAGPMMDAMKRLDAVGMRK